MSHFKLKSNAFHKITMGLCICNIHGNSCPEHLHQIQMGLCHDIGRSLNFTEAGKYGFTDTFCKIYPYASCQSDRQMPSLSPFRRGKFMGKVLVKDNAKLTNKNWLSLSYDIALRYVEGWCIN